MYKKTLSGPKSFFINFGKKKKETEINGELGLQRQKFDLFGWAG